MIKHKIHRFVSTQLNVSLQHSNGYIGVLCPMHPTDDYVDFSKFMKYLEEDNITKQEYDIWHGRFPLHGQVSLQATPKSVKAKLIIDDRIDLDGYFKKGII